MHYYEVWVASPRYHGEKALTYSFDSKLERGALVAVPLQRQQVIGVVIAKVRPPDFKTKPISRVISTHSLPEQLLKLIPWLQDYYPSHLGKILQSIIPSSLLQTSRSSTEAPPKETSKTKLPPLTDEQNNAVDTINSVKTGTILLHGDTGSGKTRVYLELAKQAIELDRSCLILTPEIGLTPQLTDTFSAIFGKQVLVLHSMLTIAQRRNAWRQMLESTKPLIVIGTRSALFSPLKNIGLIVMDEAHDHAYKQESAPYYQSSRVAARLSSLHNARLILGSATPLVADYYALSQKQSPIIRMSSSAIKTEKPADILTVKIEDRDNFTRSAYLSNQLLNSLAQALDNQEQSIIFLNRRGTARVILCNRCGWQALCPKCDITLTYHGDSHDMRCHTCGFRAKAPSACKECGNPDITFKSIGTKFLMDELHRLFPGARLQRFDTDSTKSERLEQHYTDIKAGSVDILVGTQLLSKGLDLPKLSVIGVVLADTSLLIPDYTANEATYQQLTQIMGRVGRGHRHGTIIIQSYHPNNPAIQAAIKRDYKSFYTQELAERQRFNFPPFVYIIKLYCLRATSKSAEQAANKLAVSLRKTHGGIEIIGPSPAFHERIGGKHKWQIIIRSKQRPILTKIIKNLPSGWSHDIDPANLL